ncbi:MAG: AhpC/TSA family protein [Candidatus Symbiothrix sp.]|nr:AhpC/TSA family protein [Candidatus Symbiothrix sp.]
MKFNYLLSVLEIMILFSACSGQQKGCVLEGEIHGLINPAIYVVSMSETNTKIDTLLTQEGKFQYTAFCDSLQPYVIYMEEASTYFTVWAKNGEKIRISGDVAAPEFIQVKGNETNDLLTAFRTDSSTDKTRIQSAGIFIKAHPSSIAALVLIQDYLIQTEDAELLGKNLALIESPARENPLFKRLESYHQLLLQTAVGASAPDFSVVDTQGDTLTLASFKDQYVLLAFGASTCESCNKDCPALKKIHQKQAKKKIAVLSLVFDEDRNAWKKSPPECKISWKQAVDSYGLASPLIRAYNIHSLPDYYLLDSNHHILLAHATLNEIETILAQKTEN